MDKLIDLKKTQDSLIKHLEGVIIRVENTKVPLSFNAYSITTSEIKDESSVRQLAEKFPKSGIHIYWIAVDQPGQLLKQFKEITGKTTYKCARDNKSTDSEFIYVGSCTKTKLGHRFRQHCGWDNDQTYSLQLKKWLTDDQLIFTFTYAEIDDSFVAQQLEDQLHRDLKPLFGKSGGNNKIATSR
ncbi:hypothetical protein GCM10028808_28560 [Spirosoma migulaei]